MGWKCFKGGNAAARLECARRWIAERAGGEPVLVIAASPEAAAELLRNSVDAAAFGWHRATLGRLAADLATPALAMRELTPIGALAAEAVVARVLHELY